MVQKTKQEILNTLFSSNKINITASFGIAQSNKDYDTKMIIKLADKALYEVKNSGRNSIAYN